MPLRQSSSLLLAMVALLCPLAAREPVRARKAIVAAQEPLAADVGVDVLRKGGNAVDAAVAVAFALAVTLPAAGNIGGGGFLLARFADGSTTFLDFRERAPEAASRNMYLDPEGKPTRDSVEGWRAAAVPGTVRGLDRAHRRYGRLPWPDLVAPAIRLANDGFAVSYRLERSLRGSAKLLEKFPDSRRIFLNNARLFESGEVLRQPELARTLDRIARHGAGDFYEGATARILVEQMRRHGGLITSSDLKSYEVAERKPLTGRYKDFDILTAPPPSSGGIGILQILGMLEGSGYERHGSGSAASIHYVAEAMRRFYADRSEYLGDPDFHRVPVAGLLAGPYIAGRRATIDPDRVTPSARLKPGQPAAHESTETTHLSIVDPEGNAVALTYTINGSYGSGVTAPELGFLLNNEMDDFSVKPGYPNMFGLTGGDANAIQPRKRPLSSMTPAILLRGGKLYMVIGAPGGSRIITGVLQVILNVADFGMNIQEAIDAPRFHHQWFPDKLHLEKGFSPDTVALLERRGHAIEPIANVAIVEGILAGGGWLQGGSDGRGGGKSAGY